MGVLFQKQWGADGCTCQNVSENGVTYMYLSEKVSQGHSSMTKSKEDRAQAGGSHDFTLRTTQTPSLFSFFLFFLFNLDGSQTLSQSEGGRLLTLGCHGCTSVLRLDLKRKKLLTRSDVSSLLWSLRHQCELHREYGLARSWGAEVISA